MAKHLEPFYPGFELYNDAVDLLRDVTENVKPEVLELMQRAEDHWEDVNKEKYCQPYIDYFAKRYPKFYKYHPKLMVLMILKERTLDMNMFVKFLQIRKEMSGGALDEESGARIFGQDLFNHYVAPLVDMEKEKEADS
jgi:hypothetical protein